MNKKIFNKKAAALTTVLIISALLASVVLALTLVLRTQYALTITSIDKEKAFYTLEAAVWKAVANASKGNYRAFSLTENDLTANVTIGNQDPTTGLRTIEAKITINQ